MTNKKSDDLARTARLIRILSIQAIYKGQSGHPGGSLSVADILAALYFRVMRPQPYMPQSPSGDVLVFSKGHACPALYACLHLLGLMSEKELMGLRRLGGRAQGHPASAWTAGVETSTGSLGQGCAYAVGLALAFRREGNARRVYCVLGDGCLQEGITAEAARLASHWRLNNLVFVLDYNRKTSDEHSIDPVRNPVMEFEAWGWWADVCDGHDVEKIATLLEFAGATTTRPLFVACSTVKGKGVSFMEESPGGYHGSLALSRDEYERAMAELEAG